MDAPEFFLGQTERGVNSSEDRMPGGFNSSYDKLYG